MRLFVGKYAFSDSLAAHIALSPPGPLCGRGDPSETFGGRRLAFLSKHHRRRPSAPGRKGSIFLCRVKELPACSAMICQPSAPGMGTVLTEDDLPRLAAAIKEEKA